MKVQDLPARFMRDSLSAHTDQAQFLESEAGNRAQSDGCYGLTLVLTGSSYGETEPRKVTYEWAGHNIRTLTLSELKPDAYQLNSVKNLGFLIVKLATPNGTINHLRERIKTA
jgi:hypothetical protein